MCIDAIIQLSDKYLIIYNKLKGDAIMNYFIGLDIGTNSVGWAVTDENYNVLKYHGKRLMGSRLFKEGSTANDRRVFRSARRRLKRRKYRLDLLESFFRGEIEKIDPTFFDRLSESKYHLEDKKVDTKYVLFNDKNYNDRDYYRQFPTVYHLRKELMENQSKMDLRLIFIALHSIIKRRGHFTFVGDITGDGARVENVLPYLIASLENETGYDYSSIYDKVDDIAEIILKEDEGIKDKKTKLKKVLKETDIENINCIQYLFELCIGSETKLSNIFSNKEYDDNSALKFSFKKIVYDEKRPEIEALLGDKIEVIDEAKRVYDAVILSNMLGDAKSISEAKVLSYEKHKKDLSILKSVLKNSGDSRAYDFMFKKPVKEDGKAISNYISYSKHGEEKSCSREEFYKYVKNELKGVKESSEKEYILKEIDLNKFMPIQRNTDNAVIPNQIYKRELKLILDNASKHYDFLNKVEDGYSVKEKIMMLLEFRIPYYVGPLNTYHSEDNNGHGNAWAVRKTNDKITPWNFDKVIDLPLSAEKFITRMTNPCSYLPYEYTLQKFSLLYSEFSLRNELNNLKYDGDYLPIDVREELFNEFLYDHKEFTEKRIEEFLKSRGYFHKGARVSGLNFSIKGDMKSHRDMVKIFGSNYDRKMAEDIIRWVTLFPGAPNILELKIKEKYPNISDEELKKIKHLKYKDWGTLSRKLLTEVYSEKFIGPDGEPMNIISAMRCTQNNFMKLLSDKNGFMDEINRINGNRLKKVEEISYEILDDIYASPSVKKSLWQAIKIVEEILKIMSTDSMKNKLGIVDNRLEKGEKVSPSKIFIETTRGKSVDKRTPVDRKNSILKALNKDKDLYKDLINTAENTELNLFRSKKLYLYYKQLGRCMYSGQMIDLEDLFSNSYNIDHIYPRSRTKDDSWDNLVLVRTELNNDKRDVYPNPDLKNIKEKMSGHWNTLLQLGLITQEKYYRLNRNTPFSEDELRAFINRQLVQTAQSTKLCAEVLKSIYSDKNDENPTEVVYVKAGHVSEFNHEFGLYTKVRELNDMHHAKDAYLNIVYGNMVHEKFNKRFYLYDKKKQTLKNLGKPSSEKSDEEKKEDSLNSKVMFSHTFYSKYDEKNNGKLIWDKNIHMPIVRKNVQSNNVQVSNKVEAQKGGFFNQTIYKAKDVKKAGYMPIKSSDTRLRNMEKYGGFSSISIAYYTIVSYLEADKKGRIKKYKMVPIPVYISKSEDKEIYNFISDYILSESKKTISDIEVVYRQLRLGQLVDIDGFKYYIGGKTGESIYLDSAVQIILPKSKKMMTVKDKEGKEKQVEVDNVATIKKTYKLKSEKDSIKTDEDVYIQDIELYELYDAFLEKLQTKIFKNCRKNIYDILSSEDIRNEFLSLSKIDKADMLTLIFDGMKGNKADIKLGEKKINQNRNTISLSLSNIKSFAVIEQSVTGIFENEVKIF